MTAKRHRLTHSSTSLHLLVAGAQLGVFKKKDVELHNSSGEMQGVARCLPRQIILSQKQDGRMFVLREFGPYQEMNGYNIEK